MLRICGVANLVLIALFTVECGLKIMAYDMTDQPNGYLLSNWNLLDFFIVIFSLLSLVPGLDSLSSLKLLRVLRPLRLLSRISGMKIIFEFFYLSASDILNVTGDYSCI